ncbi:MULTISPECIES: hypothetical protein [Paraclostridium]|uniref:Uncharacterized protein n=1 Tax=Paraclostridium benzoelyticum TaxID=1629550 RepID=A0A0M3DEC5_9FIRM|nr:MULTISPECIES: hypothetical protein [Paraclostridium]KKX99833.1 hypothetical protein VN21_17310 [Paraclostridium benzoelyticum]TQO55646.1 hypothetical protein D5S05_17320 [Paraclostridium bifermentans]
MNLLTSNLDWFETEIKGKQVYILSFDIDHDLYLIKFNNHKVFKVNKKSNELTLEFSDEDIDNLLNGIEDYCKKNGVKSFYKDADWKRYRLSYRQQEVANKLGVKFKTSGEFNKYLSILKCNNLMNELI